MSGGHFEYSQYTIGEIADKIDTLIEDNSINEWRHYSDETLAEFRHAAKILREAQVYVQRIDRLVSGDDGEDTFHTRLEEDLNPE